MKTPVGRAPTCKRTFLLEVFRGQIVLFRTLLAYTLLTMRILGLATLLSGVVTTRLLILARFYPVLIESDEAIVGLMARHILGGYLPVFYYGQNYMGAFEAYLTAPMFVLFGASGLVLKSTILILFLAFLTVHFKLAEEVTKSTQIAFMATACVGLSPAFLTVWSLKSRGGYMALLLFGTVSLFLAIRLIRAGPYPKLVLFLLGSSLGIAFWSHFAAVAYAIPIGLILVWEFRGQLLRYAWIGVLGFLLASLPVWAYNFVHPLVSFVRPVARRTNVFEDFENIFGTGFPILFGGRPPWTLEGDYFPLSGILVVVLFLAALGWLLRVQFSERDPGVLLLTLFACLYPLIISASGAAYFMIEPRYLLPLYSVVYIILFIALPGLKPRIVALVFLLALNLYGTFSLKGNEFVTPGYTQPIGPLIRFLRSENVRYAYAPYWIAYRLTFESGEKIICSPPPTDQVRHGPYLVEIRSNEPVPYIQLRTAGRPGNELEPFIPSAPSVVHIGDFEVFLPSDSNARP